MNYERRKLLQKKDRKRFGKKGSSKMFIYILLYVYFILKVTGFILKAIIISIDWNRKHIWCACWICWGFLLADVFQLILQFSTQKFFLGSHLLRSYHHVKSNDITVNKVHKHRISKIKPNYKLKYGIINKHCSPKWTVCWCGSKYLVRRPWCLHFFECKK